MALGLGAHRGVGVAVRALAAVDVELILRGLLVHRVVEVDGVGVLQAEVPPQQEADEGRHHDDRCSHEEQHGKREGRT